jgi:hypothetical protein
METLNPEQIPFNAETSELNRTALNEVFDSYVEQRGSERVKTHYDLLEPLPNEPADAQTPKPALTVWIPLAINSDTTVLTKALDVITTKAQENFGKPVDVVVWANAKYAKDSEKDTVAEAAAQSYTALREQLSARGEQKDLHIRTALQVLPKAEATMSNIRANYMDAGAVDAVVQDLGYDHPNVWIDADATDLNKDAFQQIEDEIRTFKTMFTHPYATRYAMDWATGQPLSEADTATKAVAITEIMRRQEKRSYGWRGYTEESGLAFAIGTYLLIGGVDTNADEGAQGAEIEGESNNLDRKMTERFLAIVDYQRKHGKDAPLPLEIQMAPPHLAKGADPEIMMNLQHKNSYISLSGRRQHAIFELGGIAALDRENDGELYTLFSDVQSDKPHAAHDPSQVAAELIKKIDKKEEFASKSSIEENRLQGRKKARIARALVARYLDNQQKTSTGK